MYLQCRCGHFWILSVLNRKKKKKAFFLISILRLLNYISLPVLWINRDYRVSDPSRKLQSYLYELRSVACTFAFFIEFIVIDDVCGVFGLATVCYDFENESSVPPFSFLTLPTHPIAEPKTSELTCDIIRVVSRLSFLLLISLPDKQFLVLYLWLKGLPFPQLLFRLHYPLVCHCQPFSLLFTSSRLS